MDCLIKFHWYIKSCIAYAYTDNYHNFRLNANLCLQTTNSIDNTPKCFYLGDNVHMKTDYFLCLKFTI